MEVRKSDGSFEEFDRRKLINIVKKAFKSAGSECNAECAKEIVDSLYVYDGILCSSIRKQIEERLGERDEKALKAYKDAKDKKVAIDDFVESKKRFINTYKKASNTANATVDDNSNVGNKNIGVLNAEIHKEENIEISRGMIMDKLKELYPDFNAKNYVKDLEKHIIYKHDESSFAGAIAPYTYSAKEVIYVKYNGKSYLIPLDSLYNLLEEKEVIVNHERDVYQKYPTSLYVYDDYGKWTQVTHITKKMRHRDLVIVKTSCGRDIVVTDNHPLIIDKKNIDNCIDAIDSVGKRQYEVDIQYSFDGITKVDLSDILTDADVYNSYLLQNRHPINRILKIDKDFGYLIGCFVGIGEYIDDTEYLKFKAKDVKLLNRINDILFTCFSQVGNLLQDVEDKEYYNVFVNSNAITKIFKNYFLIQNDIQGKTIPLNIFSFNEDFALGILEGLLDSNGSVVNDELHYEFTSRAVMLQISALLKYFDYSVDNVTRSKIIDGNFNETIWGINSSNKDSFVKLAHSFKFNGNGETNVLSVVKLDKDDIFLEQNDYIYDITTKTHTFALNNLLVHNCVSVTMYPFLTDGIEKLGGLSAAPKNLQSFCGMFCNFIFAVGSQFAGAVATSEFLLYFTHFAKIEFGDDFYKNSDSFYSIGPKFRKLLQESHYWTNDVNMLKEHDFGNNELNAIRDEIVFDSTRQLTNDELNELKQNHTLRLGDGTRTIGGQIRQYWQQVIYTLSQPASSRNCQAPFVNFSYFDKPFFEGMFGNFYFPDGTKPDWDSLWWIQKEFMQWFNAERLRCILTFPVESFTLLYKNGEFEDKEAFNFVSEEYARGHSFFTYISDTVDSLSSCCRLKNKIQTKEFNFTNGNIGVQTGSKSVITLNLSRIVQDWAIREGLSAKGIPIKEGAVIMTDKYYDSLKKYINKILERVYKYHTAYNELLWDMYDANLLPVYKAGFIDLNKQYLTIGLNGLNQAAEYLGIKCNDNKDYSKFCSEIFGNVKNQNTLHKVIEGHKITLNTELVPAESLAVKNYKWDKEDGYWVPSDTNLYASYVYKPNDKQMSVLERIRLHGKNYIGDFCDGGSAAHLNLDEHLTKKAYEKILTYAAENGCQYLTFNIPNCQCEDCKYIAKQPFTVCPKCGSKNVSLWDRVIGYLTKISNWSEGRQIEQGLRDYKHFVDANN